ncbi:UNVERIFIED_CONTAM: hypothetical protein FKN15_019912 [Acipenser sinensis]
MTDIIHERLVAVVKCKASTGQYFVQLLTEVVEKLKLDKSKCIGNATDGASNMQGKYKGFSALLSSKSPNQVHVWCYAHVLNLVLADTTDIVIASGSLFALLNDIAVLRRESYQRMNVWEKQSQDTRHRCLSPIGETRWWAKDSALKKVFGFFGKPDQDLYVEVLTLSAIQGQANMKTTVRVKTRGFTEALLRYEMILTAQIFLRIFEFTSPLSRYLQTSGMDILSAVRMVVATQDNLKGIARDFYAIKAAADTFVQWANYNIQEQDEETEGVEAILPQKRARKKKNMPGEMAQDEALTEVESAYKVEVHNQIMDTVTDDF